MMNQERALTFDTRAWLAWTAAAAAIAMSARNPLYSLVLLLVVKVVDEQCGRAEARLGLPLARIGGFILLFAALFNLLSFHVGNTVLYRLPNSWPWIGGPATLEAVVFGITTGLLLLSLLVLFSAFNAIVPTSQLVRLTPRALRDLGVVVLIAVTYVPETKRQLQRIRDAQAIRGHRLRGVKDWRPIVIPMLVGGLERAMGLAEAMVTRGYGATAGTAQPLLVQLGLAIGLLFALVGWVLTFWVNWLGWLLLAVGVVLFSWLLVRLGRHTPHTHYRQRQWTRADSLLVASAAAALLLAFMPLSIVDRSTLVYVPYPALSLPRFDPWIGLGLAALGLPALLTLLKR